MFSRVKAACLNSLTVAWGYVLAFTGILMSMVDTISEALGDPSLRDQISAAIGDARTAGRVLLGISIITILVRLRSIKKVG
jgi:hypothetical protein